MNNHQCQYIVWLKFDNTILTYMYGPLYLSSNEEEWNESVFIVYVLLENFLTFRAANSENHKWSIGYLLFVQYMGTYYILVLTMQYAVTYEYGYGFGQRLSLPGIWAGDSLGIPPSMLDNDVSNWTLWVRFLSSSVFWSYFGLYVTFSVWMLRFGNESQHDAFISHSWDWGRGLPRHRK